MKNLIPTLLFPFFVSASGGFNDQLYSIHYGGSWRQGYRPGQQIELLAEHAFQSCIRKTTYYGFGISATFSPVYTEYGIRGLVNPTHYMWRLSRKMRVMPYCYLQVNLKQQPESGRKADYNFRPGMGMSLLVRNQFPRMITAGVQLGYTCNDRFTTNHLVLEATIGIGLRLHRRYKPVQELEVQ